MNSQLKHVLVAEDDTFLVDMMCKVLTKHGLRVSKAYNGQEAIDLVEKDTPDLVLLDLLMPKVDGFAVLQHRQEKNMHFPVVICSNLSDKADKEKCQALHVNDYVIKSDMDDEQLWPVVEKYLR